MATKLREAPKAVIHTWRELREGDFGILDAKILPEDELRLIADHIKKTSSFGTVFRLIDDIPKRSRAYDWNVGSILQHLDPELTVSSLQHVEHIDALYESTGLAWVLGEYRTRNPFIIEYLNQVVRRAKSSDAWWRAAFSLEKLSVDDAFNLLKRSLRASGAGELEQYLDRLQDKRSIIGILVRSTVGNVQDIIYPRVRQEFLHGTDQASIINCCWLISRLRLIDNDILKKLTALMRSADRGLKYYAFFALQHNATEQLRPVLEKAATTETDPMIRKMAVRGLRSLGNVQSLAVLEAALSAEQEQLVITELSKAIYHLKNPSDRERALIEASASKNENGMITDENDRKNVDPSVLAQFFDAQDPENVCLDLVLQKVRSKRVMNPVDLATGSGRVAWQIAEKVRYAGTLYGIDGNAEMCAFTERNLRRERRYTQGTAIVNGAIRDLPTLIDGKSNLILSACVFPGHLFDGKECLAELKAVHDALADDGEFYTIGWDETFKDELSQMWFKYAPDGTTVWDFDEERAASGGATRNCGLTWFKKGIAVPLQFNSLKEAAHVMGYLFGRDAAKEIVRKNKTQWSMSLGITRDTKKDLARVIAGYEKSVV